MTINPLRLEIPTEIITERLLLRSPNLGDGAVMIDKILSSLSELKAWMPWATDEYSVNDAEDWCRRAASRMCTREQATYLMFTRESLRHIGTLHSCFRGWEVPKFEIGYWLATSEVGHGYMTEAVIALTRMTFENLKARRIEIRTDALNHRSRRVAERAGYTLEGILRNDQRDGQGDLRDECIYAVVS